jgi:hypothetical protein
MSNIRNFVFSTLCALAIVSPRVVAANEIAWEYLVLEVSKLDETLKDPTNDCKDGNRLVVLGRLRWELIQVYHSPASGDQSVFRASGKLVMRPGPDQGSIEIKGVERGQSRSALVAVFKRPLRPTSPTRSC